MKTFELSVQKRQNMTKNELSRFRKGGNIPAILYGKHLEVNFPLSIDTANFVKILKTKGRTVLLEFSSTDKDLNGRSALIKDLQRDSISEQILHVDLIEIKQDEVISVEVRFNFIGIPSGVKNSGGVLEVLKRNIQIECLPSLIPSSIDLDISALELGESLHISDLKMDKGIQILDATDIAIVSVNIPKVVKAAEETLPIEGEEGLVAGATDAVAKEEGKEEDKKDKKEDKKK